MKRFDISKVYVIDRDPNGDVTVTVEYTEHNRTLHYRLRHIKHHSPTGLEYGYGGSGPADMALSILCDFFGQSPTKTHIYRGHFKAQPHYMTFKWDFIRRLKQRVNHHKISAKDIQDWLNKRAINEHREADLSASHRD
jgi:hypothetical protein